MAILADTSRNGQQLEEVTRERKRDRQTDRQTVERKRGRQTERERKTEREMYSRLLQSPPRAEGLLPPEKSASALPQQ